MIGFKSGGGCAVQISKTSGSDREGIGRRGESKHTVAAATYLFLIEYSVLFCAARKQKQVMYCYKCKQPKIIYHFAKAPRETDGV